MYSHFSRIALSVAVTFLASTITNSNVNAEFVVQIGSATQITNGLSFVAGSTGNQIEIWGSSDVASPDFVAYGLAFDVGTTPGAPPTADGAGFSSAFSNFSGDFSGGFFSGSGFTTNFEASPGGDNYDLYASAAEDSFVTGLPLAANTPVKLFTLSFNIDANTTLGTYSFTFRPDALLGGADSNQLVGTGLTPTQMSASGLTSFTVTAVPEPTSLALVGAAGLAGLVRLRRLKKRQAVAEKAQETAA